MNIFDKFYTFLLRSTGKLACYVTAQNGCRSIVFCCRSCAQGSAPDTHSAHRDIRKPAMSWCQYQSDSENQTKLNLEPAQLLQCWGREKRRLNFFFGGGVWGRNWISYVKRVSGGLYSSMSVTSWNRFQVLLSLSFPLPTKSLLGIGRSVVLYY